MPETQFDKTESWNPRKSVLGKAILVFCLSAHTIFFLLTWPVSINDQWMGDDRSAVPADGENNSPSANVPKLTMSTTTTANDTATKANSSATSVADGHPLPPQAKHQLTVFSTSNNEFHDLRAPLFYEHIPLIDLVHTSGHADPHCRSDNPMFNISAFPTILVVNDEDGSSSQQQSPPLSNYSSSQRQIPKIIHFTSKSRCITSKIKTNILKWKLPGYTLYFHDDAAVDRLLAKYFPIFPHLQNVQECSISGAAKADIWRYLVLYEYGGIYTDIDNAPGELFKNGTIIKDDDDAFFVVERIGVLSQYFMASSPHHPILYLMVVHCLSRLVLYVEEIGTQYVPFVTGPGVTKSAMILFMKDDENFQKVKAGIYTGIDNRTVTVAGTRARSNRIVKRESVPGKLEDYAAMNMQHFSRSKNTKLKDSCYEYMYKQAILATKGTTDDGQ